MVRTFIWPSSQSPVICSSLDAVCAQVILSTNIAETSVTVTGMRYVVDCGLVKQRTFSARTGMDVLQVCPVSQAQARQRSGRAGREAPGRCYRVYTETDYHALQPSTTPEIIRTNLSTVMLQLKSMGIENPLEFEYLDKPRIDSCVSMPFYLLVQSSSHDCGGLFCTLHSADSSSGNSTRLGRTRYTW